MAKHVYILPSWIAYINEQNHVLHENKICMCLFHMCTKRTKSIVTMMHALIMPGPHALCDQSLWSHYPIINDSLLSLPVSQNFEHVQKRQWQYLSVLYHYTVIPYSVMSPMSVVIHLSEMPQPLSTWQPPCNQLFYSPSFKLSIYRPHFPNNVDGSV